MTAEKGNRSDDQQNPSQDLKLQQQLRRIDRSRSRLMVCFLTLPLYVVALVLLLNEGRGVTLLMFIYMGVYAVFAINMVVKDCPRCGEQFFVKAFFLNFITRKCVHCGISSRVSQNDIKKAEGRHF